MTPKGQKVIARGNVEVYYNNNVLTADQVTYDQSANLLTAQGNVVCCVMPTATLRAPTACR